MANEPSDQDTLLAQVTNGGLSQPLLRSVKDSAQSLSKNLETFHAHLQEAQALARSIQALLPADQFNTPTQTHEESNQKKPGLLKRVKSRIKAPKKNTEKNTQPNAQLTLHAQALEEKTQSALRLSACAEQPTPGEQYDHKVTDQPEYLETLDTDPQAAVKKR
jgi:hypothetical protein